MSLADYRHRVTRTSVTPEAFRAFLVRPETRGWIFAIVEASVPADDAEDVTQDALNEALKAFVTAPPSKDEVLIVWIATIARRVTADFLKKRGRRRKYEGTMPDGPNGPSTDSADEAGSADDEGDVSFGAGPHRVAEPSYDPREGSVDDLELKGTFLFQWLERQVAQSPIDRETFEIVLEHGLGQKTYRAIADERGMTLTVLSSRVFAFRQKYAPRYKRERDRVLILLLLFGVAIVAIVLWLLSRPGGSPGGTTRSPATPILDRVLGNPLPVSHPRPDDLIKPDAGALEQGP